MMDFVLTCEGLRRIVCCLLGLVLVVEGLNIGCNLGISLFWIIIGTMVLIFMFGVWIGKCFLRLD